MTTKVAKELKDLQDEYERIRQEALFDSSLDDTYRLELISAMEILTGKITQLYYDHVKTEHFIVPENEFTKH